MGNTIVTSAGDADIGSIQEFTWANKPAATSFKGLARITDVGIRGSNWYSDGANWSAGSPIIMAQKAEGWIVPSLAAANAATYSQSGTTVTVTSALHGIPNTSPNPNPNGKQVYLIIGSGLAATGFYSNFQYVGANTFTCISTVSQTTSGICNTNTAEITIDPVTTVIPGGLLGLNGGIVITPAFEYLSSANNKTIRIKYGTAAPYSKTRTTVNHDLPYIEIINKNSLSKQYAAYSGAASFTSGTTTTTAVDTQNTANNLNVTATVQCAAANEYIMVNKINILVMPS